MRCFHACPSVLLSFLVLGALLGLQAPFEPTQHMSPQKKEGKGQGPRSCFALVPQLQADSEEVSLPINAEFGPPALPRSLGMRHYGSQL